MATPNQAIPAPNTKYAIIFFIVGVLGALGLISLKFIGEYSFVSLIGLSLLGSFVVWFKDRIIKAQFSTLSFELSQIQQVRDDVIAREEHIRKIALIIGEITLFSSATNGRHFSAGISELRRKWYELKVKEMMDTISAFPDEEEKVFKYIKQFNLIYTPGYFDEEKTNIGWKKFWDFAISDISNNPNIILSDSVNMAVGITQ